MHSVCTAWSHYASYVCICKMMNDFHVCECLFLIQLRKSLQLKYRYCETKINSSHQPVWTTTSINDPPFWLMESICTNAHSRKNTYSHTIVFGTSGHRISVRHIGFSAWQTKTNPRKHNDTRGECVRCGIWDTDKSLWVCAHQYIKPITLGEL